MSDVVVEPMRETPVSHRVDVVVAGGGTAGVAAAVCAARMGLKVVVVERTAQAGGMVSHVTAWLNDFDTKGGFAREFLDYMTRAGLYERPYYIPYATVPWFDKALTEAGARPLFLAQVVAPIVEEGALRGVIVESKSGRRAILADAVIDATGDGDVAARAGADFEMGRPADGACQAATLSHLWIHYQGETLDTEPWRAVVRQAAEAAGGGFRLVYDHGRLRRMAGGLPAHLNGTPHALGYNPLDAESLSDMLIELRRQAMEYFDLMKRHAPGFASIACGPFSGIPGVRESRRIVCDDRMTVDRARSGVKTRDGLFTVTQSIDIHLCTPQDPPIRVERVKPYHMTYRALLPKGLENIGVAGRCIGGDHECLASYRIIADCFAMGEALAIACRLAKERKLTLRQIPAGDVAGEMRSRGYAE